MLLQKCINKTCTHLIVINLKCAVLIKSNVTNMKIRRQMKFFVHVFIEFAYQYQFNQIHCSHMYL